MGWWSRLVPVSWKRTLWAAHLRAERLALGGELADQVRELAVVWVAAGFGSEDRDDLFGDVVPVVVEAFRAGVEEHEPGCVRRAAWGEVGGVEGVAELVGGEDVQAPVADERGRLGHRVEDPLHGGADLLLGRPAAASGGGLGRAGEVDQV